jgi:predicted RNA-binding Zn ribbon-like protein
MGGMGTIADLKLLGTWLCLDFANTSDWRGREVPEEKLNSYRDLLVWSERAGIIDGPEALRLEALAQARGAEAGEALGEAVRFREALYRLFAAIAEGRKPAKGDLSLLNHWLSEGAASKRIAAAGEGYRWEFDPAPGSLQWLLHPVAHSAAELLLSPALGRLKKCGDAECGWLFIDRSKNRSRRWCDMRDCGNRAKARRHYQRARQAGGRG